MTRSKYNQPRPSRENESQALVESQGAVYSNLLELSQSLNLINNPQTVEFESNKKRYVKILEALEDGTQIETMHGFTDEVEPIINFRYTLSPDGTIKLEKRINQYLRDEKTFDADGNFCHVQINSDNIIDKQASIYNGDLSLMRYNPVSPRVEINPDQLLNKGEITDLLTISNGVWTFVNYSHGRKQFEFSQQDMSSQSEYVKYLVNPKNNDYNNPIKRYSIKQINEILKFSEYHKNNLPFRIVDYRSNQDIVYSTFNRSGNIQERIIYINDKTIWLFYGNQGHIIRKITYDRSCNTIHYQSTKAPTMDACWQTH